MKLKARTKLVDLLESEGGSGLSPDKMVPRTVLKFPVPLRCPRGGFPGMDACLARLLFGTALSHTSVVAHSSREGSGSSQI